MMWKKGSSFKRNLKKGMIVGFLTVCFSTMLHAQQIATDSDNLTSTDFGIDTISGLVPNEREIRAGLLYDVERNKIIWEKDMDYAYPIASLTKMMVGLLAIEDIEAEKVCLDDRITVTRTYKKKLRRRRYTTYTVEENYSLEDLLKMAMVASHNESTVWIAKHCSGTLEAFVERMNKRAQELGMTKTLYSNPSGLPAVMRELDNSSSPRDQLILGMEVLKHPKLVEITSIPYATVNNGKGNVSYRNHNGLVINYGLEVDGIKTGFTRAAGFCLVASGKRGNHRLVSVVFGCRSPWIRNGLVANMMNNYYDAVKLGRLGEAAPDLTEYKLFMDSVQRGLAFIRPNVEPKINDDSDDEVYAYTYKTVTQKIKKPHTVRKGENLGRIADRYNVSLTDLKKWNRLKNSTIHPGQRLYVYSTVKKRIPVKLVIDPDESIADLQPSQDTSEQCETEISSVHQPHATLKVKEEVAVNKDSIQKKSEPSTSTASKARFIYHTVQPGDTLWNIAQRYQIDMQQIKKLNNITNSKLLKKGTRIKIPVKGS
ncbi:MAG: LysM peptidoglycan-binding domain-containing protein [Bacteroidia bacterium]